MGTGKKKKKRQKGKAFVSRLKRGRKEEEKKKNPTMSTVKRPRGRVSELWKGGGTR